MSIAVGSNAVSKIYLGETEVTKAYLGDTEIFGTAAVLSVDMTASRSTYRTTGSVRYVDYYNENSAGQPLLTPEWFDEAGRQGQIRGILLIDDRRPTPSITRNSIVMGRALGGAATLQEGKRMQVEVRSGSASGTLLSTFFSTNSLLAGITLFDTTAPVYIPNYMDRFASVTTVHIKVLSLIHI